MARNKNEIITNPNWWKRRSLYERFLLIFIPVSLIATGALIFFLLDVLNCCQRTDHNKLNGNSINSHTGICLSHECVHSSSSILSKIDTTVDPCNDFYNFACGNFIKTTSIPDDKSSVNMFSVIEDALANQLNGLLAAEVSETEIKPFILAKYMYQTCMATGEIEKTTNETMKKVFEQVGGWPVLGRGWNENQTWQDIVHHSTVLGYQSQSIFAFSVAADWLNSSRKILDIDEPRLGMIQEYLMKGLNESHVQSYFKYMVEIAEYFGANSTEARSQLKESLEFEIELAKICMPRTDRRNLTLILNRLSVDELQTRFNYTSWLTYLNTILPKKVQISKEEVLSITSLHYLEKLGPLLAKTPKRTIANYIIWRMADSSITFLSKDLREKHLEHKRRTTGQQSDGQRWRECTDIVNNKLSAAVGALYVRKYFQQNAKHEALEMVRNIRNEFSATLNTVDWMDAKTRDEALRKLNAMDTLIGYPDELMDDEKLQGYFKDLNVSGSTYLEDVLAIQKYFGDFEFGRLRELFNKTDWIDHSKPADVNAYYSGIENNIQFPAGILQGVFFAVGRPRYMNYGAMGLVIGHEISHGYDDTGHEFNADGNHVDWWHKTSKEAFVRKAKCIITQYENYTEPIVNEKINGINTQGENIADNGGVKVAYRAYKKWMETNGREPSLPGIDFTAEQLFWLSAAQSWCSVYTPETLRSKIITEYHAPERFRIIGSLSNSVDFSNDFQCPIGSQMNPVQKCEVW